MSARRFIVLTATLMTAWSTTAFVTPSHATDDKIAKLEAAFIYRIAKFAKFPNTAFPDRQAPIRVYFVGKTPVASIFEQDVTNKTAHHRAFVVKALPGSPSNLDDALAHGHVVFIGADFAALSTSYPKLRKAKALVISDLPAFATRGGAIQLKVDGDKLKMLVNQQTLDRCTTHLSASLLKIATLVGQE